MARQVGTTVTNSFVNGLITEATGMNFPENAVTSTDNCVFKRTGVVERRKGVDLELGYVTKATTANTNVVIHAYKWETIGNLGKKDLAVVQVGAIIYFYEINNGALSAGTKTFIINLANYLSAGSTTSQIKVNRASFSSGNGILFIAHRHCTPFYVSYDGASDTIDDTRVSPRIRDFKGVEDSLNVEVRPLVLSPEHRYNLENQGWTGQPTTTSGTMNPITYWDLKRIDFPSNSDVWWQYKNTNSILDDTWITKYAVGNSQAARGAKIIDPFDVTRAGVKETTNGIQPEFTEFYGSRVWWAGVRTGEFASNVYFSKIIERPTEYGICYQVNDPTSEFLSDLLPTDGGVIVIPGIAETVFMKALGSSLYLFATNGVWEISGSDFSGFAANSHQIKKISEVSCLSPYSFISAAGVPIWWGSTGIYTLVKNQTGESEVLSLTDDTIKTFFADIPARSKLYAQGTFDELNKKLTWIYRGVEAINLTQDFIYDSFLEFDVSTKAFYTHTIGTSNATVTSILNVGGLSAEDSQEDVVDTAGIVVTDALGNNVTVKRFNPVVLNAINKLFITGFQGSFTNVITWGEMYDTSYLDWVQVSGTGVDYLSTFTGGYQVRGDIHKDFQSNYITIMSEVETNSSFLFSGAWDYAVNTNSSRITTRQQGYKDAPNFKYSTRKLKVRGTGKALQYKVDSVQGKPFNIVGWSVKNTINSEV